MQMKFIPVVLSTLILVACGSGGSGGSGGGGSGFVEDPIPPSPTPSPGTYNGVPYSQLGQPVGLANVYPSAYFPTQLQIAYGRNGESQVANLTAYVTMNTPSGSALCSATPVYYNGTSTFLIGAAHCFVTAKNSPNILTRSDLNSVGNLTIYNGVRAPWAHTYPVQAVYLRQDYCYGGTFASGGECPNFSPNSGSGTQGNDIAIIQIAGEYGESGSSANYPQVVPASQYPLPYTMAPVLSIGYGINTQIPLADDSSAARSTMFYVANYQYWQQDATGYHYLYNSYYNAGSFAQLGNSALVHHNNSSFAQTGYSALVCGGDSGGGDLFWNGSKWLLLSEHTYGPSGVCGTFYNSLPNGATNVSAYYGWVQSILQDSNPVADCGSSIANCVTN